MMILYRRAHRIALIMMMLLLGSNSVVAAVISNNSNVATNFCGPTSPKRAMISIDGSAAGVTLAQAWAASYQRVCQKVNTTTFQITRSNTARAARRMCTTTTRNNPKKLDIAILSRPFLSNEAKATGNNNNNADYQFQCSKGDVSQRILQAPVATNAFVLVTVPNGIASFCIKQLFNDGLALQQVRALYSTFTPEKIFNISTPSPSASPSMSLSPSAVTQQPTFPPQPTPIRPPTPIGPPTRRPFTRRPTARRPTLPPGSRPPIFWGSPAFRPRSAAFPKKQASSFGKDQFDCTQEQAMVAGPPTAFDLYQDFARTILTDFVQGERVTRSYVPLPNIDAMIRFLQNQTNAIALVSLPEYRANQGRLVAVNINDLQGINRKPNTRAIRSRQYPLSFSVFMAIVDPSNNTQTKLVRSLLLYGYSTSDGNKDVAQSGLVPLSSSTKIIWINRISQAPTT